MAAPVQAEPTLEAVCTFLFPITFSPGLTLQTATGTYGTNGETGSGICVGRANGYDIRGGATFGFQGAFTNATCLNDVVVSGVYFYSLQTDAGPAHFTGSFTDVRVGLVALIDARQPGSQIKAIGVPVPTKGDCINTPVTEAIGSVTAVLVTR
jgi:hypothetical protein